MHSIKYVCNCCGASFTEPELDIMDDGITRIVMAKRCPKCDSTWLDELVHCPTCNGGWMREDDKCCEKCRLYGIGELKRFVRGLSLPIVQALDDALEGGCLEEFR